MIFAPSTQRQTVADALKLRRALAALLLELRDVLSDLTSEQYSQKPVGPVRASVGGHVRHSLDHLESALVFGDFDDLNYDNRRRGTAVESDRSAALAKIDELLDLIEEHRSGNSAEGRPLTLSAMVSAEGEPVAVQSTTDRELLFVFSHTLHHNALIRVMVELLGGQVPERFGYAPATLAFMDTQPCAR
jgi:uncharacterized damage-inducible protein DinB